MTLAHFQQVKNSAVLDRGQGIFKNFYFVGFKFKDFKMCPQGQECPQGTPPLHNSIRIVYPYVDNDREVFFSVQWFEMHWNL